jgi:hypothetical protein
MCVFSNGPLSVGPFFIYLDKIFGYDNLKLAVKYFLTTKSPKTKKGGAVKILRKIKDGALFLGASGLFVIVVLIDATRPARKRLGALTAEEQEEEYESAWPGCHCHQEGESFIIEIGKPEDKEAEKEIIAFFGQLGIPPEKIGENIGTF